MNPALAQTHVGVAYIAVMCLVHKSFDMLTNIFKCVYDCINQGRRKNGPVHVQREVHI